jgi:site-specific recombinase XerD
MNEFINEVMLKLNNKLSENDFNIVYNQLVYVSNKYNITKKETLPAVPFEDVVEVKHYLMSRKIEGLAQSSLKQYAYILKTFFLYAQKSVKDITTIDIQIYLYKAKEARNLKASSIDNIRIALNAFFNWCVDNDYIIKNPCKRISPIKFSESTEKPLTVLELDKLRDACKDIREYAMLEFLYSTGCRVSEFVNVLIDDIDFSSRQVNIRHGKGDKQRYVYYSLRAENAIKLYLETRNCNSPYLFVASKIPHNKLTTRSVEKFISRLADKADIEHVHPHRFRKTMATDALQHGMPLENVQKLLGHSDINTTMIYAKVSQNELKYSHSKYIV